MEPIQFATLSALALDPTNGWSIGSFGAIGEFVRAADEPATIERTDTLIEIVTARGGMRIASTGDVGAIAWDSLSADGESWGHALAVCVPVPDIYGRVIVALGLDSEALREEDRNDRLFDLGVGVGAVHMCLRTADPALIAALDASAGASLLTVPSLMAEVIRAQPHRVLLSPIGRIEIYQPIPPADGKSPLGPHTHLLPKLLASGKAHSSNVPIPEGWQSMLTLHPRSPWWTMLGERHPFKPELDEGFQPFLTRYGLPEDHEIEDRVRGWIEARVLPTDAVWPETRRGRTKARIVLRRIATEWPAHVAAWRQVFDRAPVEQEEAEPA